MARRTSQPWPVGLHLDGGSEREPLAPELRQVGTNRCPSRLIGAGFNAFGWRLDGRGNCAMQPRLGHCSRAGRFPKGLDCPRFENRSPGLGSCWWEPWRCSGAFPRGLVRQTGRPCSLAQGQPAGALPGWCLWERPGLPRRKSLTRLNPRSGAGHSPGSAGLGACRWRPPGCSPDRLARGQPV